MANCMATACASIRWPASRWKNWRSDAGSVDGGQGLAGAPDAHGRQRRLHAARCRRPCRPSCATTSSKASSGWRAWPTGAWAPAWPTTWAWVKRCRRWRCCCARAAGRPGAGGRADLRVHELDRRSGALCADPERQTVRAGRARGDCWTTPDRSTWSSSATACCSRRRRASPGLPLAHASCWTKRRRSRTCATKRSQAVMALQGDFRMVGHRHAAGKPPGRVVEPVPLHQSGPAGQRRPVQPALCRPDRKGPGQARRSGRRARAPAAPDPAVHPAPHQGAGAVRTAAAHRDRAAGRTERRGNARCTNRCGARRSTSWPRWKRPKSQKSIEILAEMMRLRRACCNPELVAPELPASAAAS